MMTKNVSHCKRAYPEAVDPFDRCKWLGKFPKWLYRAAVNARKAGKFPKGSRGPMSKYDVLSGLRELAGPFGCHLVDHWGAERGRLILEPYADPDDLKTIQRVEAIADALDCFWSIDPQGSQWKPLPAGQDWAPGYPIRIEFRPNDGSRSPAYWGYPRIRLADDGQTVRCDVLGLLLHGREPEELPDEAEVALFSKWLEAAGVQTVDKPGVDGEGLLFAIELQLGKQQKLTLGALIVAADRAGIPIDKWSVDGLSCPRDVLLGVDSWWFNGQLPRGLRSRGRVGARVVERVGARH